MIRYAATIFLSAFLLFQIQPIIARAILPWFGGTAAVWTTCMMFFQIVLLLGYAYAHLLRYSLSPRNGWLVHAIVLGGAACFANVMPAEQLQPNGTDDLTFAILKTLGLTIGLPFFALSTTGPLIQAWQSTTHTHRSPYRLYALSNLGSMLALISYPFCVERFLSIDQQVTIWRISFLAFCGLCFWSGWQTIRISVNSVKESTSDRTERSPGNQRQLSLLPTVWIALAMAASIMLLATTNLMCQEVASVPFLWILPLALYLLSFIICFDRPTLYRRRIFMPLLVVSSIVSILVVHLNVMAGFALQVGALSTVCFAASMTCHGELERLKPATTQLTWFYLLVSIGGSLGGIFVAVIAPRWFNGFYEFQIGLLMCLLVPLGVLIFEHPTDGKSTITKGVKGVIAAVILFTTTLVICSLVYFLDPSYHPDVVYQARNEYGLVAVIDKGNYRIFVNGRIEHGGQSLEKGTDLQHGSYYHPGSGVAIAFEAIRDLLHQSKAERGLQIGVLGLGAGGMMTWGGKDDAFVFFEINPEVEKIAREYFSYLGSSPSKSEVVLGDGRLQLERRIESNTSLAKTSGATTNGTRSNTDSAGRFDLLFMDAFSSDSIPLHLLTSECFDVYLQNLHPDGILVAHITNRFVDLRPVVYQQAVDHGLTPILIDCHSPDGQFETQWVLMSSNQALINSDAFISNLSPWPTDMKPIRWTDDFASLAEVINWSGKIDWDSLGAIKNKE